VHRLGTRIPLTLHAYIAIGLLGLLLLSLSHLTSIGTSAIFDFLQFISTPFGPNPSHALLHASLHVASHLYHLYFISQSALLMSSSIPLFDKLNSNNYNTWNGDMEAWFRAQALWRIVSGVSKPPTVSATPKEGEEDKLEAWQLKADKAAGIMWLMVDNTQRVHFRGIKDNPVKMWGALKEVHMQKRPGTRFNAYDDLFSIRKREEEDLQSLINRVDDALHRICDLRSTACLCERLNS